MNLKKSALLLLFVSFSTSFAADTDKTNITSLDAYRVGYTDGYEKGKEEGIEEGLKLAREMFKKIYEEKLQEYKEIEAGKILIKEKRVSYPRTYLVGNRVVVEGCKIISAYDDLLERIPIRNNTTTSTTATTTNTATTKPEEYQKPTQSYKVNVSVDNEEYLRNMDVLYFKNSSNNTYTVYFKNKEDMDYFCRRIGKCLEK